MFSLDFIKNKSPTEVFSCEFWEIVKLVTLLKTKLKQSCFIVKTWNIFKDAYFIQHLRMADSKLIKN